jgi:hypothetical protein
MFHWLTFAAPSFVVRAAHSLYPSCVIPPPP